ncbi:MAG TPA: PQQ-dependent dehydrogenase, methanol/ethanol family [Bryobacteraceae bacterium]|nr:PQQ-dependent dehydrogenase, methanol/ethanol family [Bryobacteraceae bacterium]
MRFSPTLLIFLLALSSAPAQDAGATHADWPHYGGTEFSWRYSALDQINKQNVKALTPAWLFQTGDYAENLQATPIVQDGVMYLITARAHVFALDAATGREIWNYKYPEGPRSVPGFVGNRGVDVGDGKVFFGTKDNYVVALDQKTGRQVWRVNVDDVHQCSCNISAAPLVVKDKVIVGGTNGDGAHRGYITAFSTKTGRLAWRWYVIPGPGEKGHETWKGDSWKFGGGSPWLTGSYDPSLNLVYWGTGNAAADFYDADRMVVGADKSKDANLYTASVVALDPDTGKLRWHHQEVHDDVWDYDSAYEVLLMDREIRGQMRQVLVHMNKSGMTSVLDRATGELLRVFSVPDLQTWITGITEDGKLVGRNEPPLGKATWICPSAAGAKSWNSMAYSPRTGLLYVPVNELCSNVTPNNNAPVEGQNYMNGDFPVILPPGRSTYSHVDAWDPVTAKRLWTVPYKYVLLASMLATAGDLVFTGNPEGEFFALDAKNGDKLWSYQTGAGNRGGSVAYSVNGRQYIATTTGWHSSVVGGAVQALFPDQDWRLGSTLVVFALPEGSR